MIITYATLKESKIFDSLNSPNQYYTGMIRNAIPGYQNVTFSIK